MEKLDKVIAGLRHCGTDAYPGECQKCPYEFEPMLSCLDAMCNEAVEVIEALRAERDDLRKDIETQHRINEDWRVEVARLHKRIDEARVEGARLAPVAAACEKPRTRYAEIHNMSPMQMVNWIFHMKTVCDCCDRQYICGIPDDEVTEEYCLEHILMWLAQEAEK